jgi:hypothetical protein
MTYRRNNRIPLIYCLLILVITTGAVNAMEKSQQSLIDIKPYQRAQFGQWTPQHAAAWRTAWPRLLATAELNENELNQTLSLAGYETSSNSNHVRIIREMPGSKLGHGMYAINLDASHLFIQAPHADTDIDTGKIALRLFNTGRIKLLAMNTASRYSSIHADQAHTLNGPFYLMSQQSLLQYPTLAIIQLHGFGLDMQTKYKFTDRTIIVSNGSKEPDAKTIALAQCFSSMSLDVKLYPTQTLQLGGTQNTIGQLTKKHIGSQFIHLEMASALRSELKTDDALLQQFSSCLNSL